MSEADPEIREIAARWFARKMNRRSWTAADDDAFRAWLRESPRHLQEIEAISSVYQTMGEEAFFPKVQVNAVLRKKSPVRWSAAIGLAAAAIAFGIFFLFAGETYETGIGELREVSLPDGTKAHLDAGTRLVCHFSESKRLIKLASGGAMFAVAEDDARPFEIQTSSAVVQDIGTTFDVHVHEDHVSVSVEEGIVEIRNRKAESSMQQLKAGQTLSWSGSGAIPPPSQNHFAFAPWREGRIFYTEKPLSVVLADLRRYSPQAIQLSESSLGSLKVSGALRPSNHRQALEVLEEILPIRFREVNAEIRVESGSAQK